MWEYHTSTKISTSFTPFHLVYSLEVLFPIECEIPSLKLEIKLLPATSEEEECFLYLARLSKTRRDVAIASETHKKQVKAQFEKNAKPRVFSKK